VASGRRAPPGKVRIPAVTDWNSKIIEEFLEPAG